MAEAHPDSPAASHRRSGGRKRLLPGIALLLLLVLPPIAYIIIYRATEPSAQPVHLPQIIAGYQADYSHNEPKPPWRYLWNAFGPIGAATNYATLIWDARRYAAHTTPEWPHPAPCRYMRLTEAGGHPGQGMGQGWEVDNHVDRFVIAAFTVTEAGSYWITNSFVHRNDGVLNGSIHLRVFVNDREIGPLVHCWTREEQLFDRALGTLNAGDVIYVAVGPNEVDTNDSFGWDFSIAR